MKNLQTSSIRMRTRPARLFAALAAVCLAACCMSLALGPVNVPLPDLLRALFSGEAATAAERIALYSRLPRTCGCLIAGAALAVSGAVIQGVLSNPLAAPNVIGVNAGAGLAAALCCAIAPSAYTLVPLAAFAGALFSVLLVLLINHTKIGMAMRAVAKDFETSTLMGIKINNVISMTFIIGSFLAAIGSMLFFTNYPGVTPTVGAMPGLKAFVAAVFGGIGSIPGAVIGAFIIGICENIIKGLDTLLVAYGVIPTGLGLSTFADAFTFVLLIIILVFKPTGLFGEKATDKV